MKKLLITIASFFIMSTAHATWPNKPITIIVPFPAGGPADTLARAHLQQPLQDYLKVPVIVVNIAGTNASVAANHMLEEHTHDNTFLFSDFEFVIGQTMAGTHLYKKFTPTNLVATTPLLFYGKSDTDHILERFKAEMQNKSTVNVGYINGMYGWLSQVRSPLNMNLVPYKGGAALSLDVRGGHVEYGLSGAGGVWNSVYVDHSLNPIFITTSARHPAFPNVPTAKEVGFIGPVSTEWFVFWAGNDVDPEIQKTFSKAVRTVVAAGKMQELNKTGYVIVNYNQADTQKFINLEIEKYKNLTYK